MKNVNNLGKRLLALLIAVVMVVSLMPMDVRAEEDPAPETITSVQTFCIEMTVKKVERTEETTIVDPETNEEKTTTVTNSYYAYSATAVDMNGKSLVDAEGNPWKMIVSPIEEGEQKVIIEDGAIYVSATTTQYTLEQPFNGMNLLTSISADEIPEGKTEATKRVCWEASIPAWGNVYAGAAFSYPAAEPALGAGCSVAEGYAWTAEYSVTAEDGKYYAPDSGSVSVKYTLSDGTNIAAAFESAKAVEPVSIETSMTVNGTALGTFATAEEAQANVKWYTVPATVQALADAGADLKVLPNIDGSFSGWTRDSGNVWNAAVAIEADANPQTVALDGKYLTVGVETVIPSVTIEKTYDHRTGIIFGEKKTTAIFSVGVGVSGIGQFKVNGEANSDVTSLGNGLYSVTLPQTDHVSIEVVSVAGNSSEKKELASQADLNVTFQYKESANTQGTGADGLIYDPEGKIVITLTGTNAAPYTMNKENTVITALDKDGVAIAPSQWTSNGDQTQWTCEVSTSNGLTKLEVTPKDAVRDGDTFPYGGAMFGVDTTAPSVATVVTDVAADVADGINYYDASEVVYTVSVQENNLDVASSFVTYTTADEAVGPVYFGESSTGTYTATFTVPTGSNLTDIRMYAKDKAGLERDQSIARNDKIDCDAPVVEFSISENVKQFYTNSAGQIFAVLDPARRGEDATEDAEVETVVLTAKVTDMSIESLEGWTDGGKTESGARIWTKEFSAQVKKDTSAMLAFKVDVADHFGKKPTANSAVAVSATPTADKYTATVDLEQKEGVYSYVFKIDRRTPDNISELVQAPEITLTSTEIPATSSNNRELYNGGENGTITFSMNVDDLYVVEIDPETKEIINSENDSGVDGLTLKTEVSSNQADFLAVSNTELTEAGASTITVALNGENETNEAKLKVTISDEVGNTYVYVKNFAVDNLAPRIEVEYNNNEVCNEKYFDADRIATITLTDLNASLENTTITSSVTPTAWGAGAKANSHVATASFTEGEHNFAIASTDLAGNATANDEAVNNDVTGGSFIIDLTNPVLKVTKTVEAGKSFIQEDGTTEFYNGQVVYTISAADAYLDSAAYQYYYIDASNKEVVSELIPLENGKEATIEINNGEQLTCISLTATDYAGRKACAAADLKSNVPFEYDEQVNFWHYKGKTIAVDTMPAAVNLEKIVTDGKWVQSYEDYDYYNAPLTYSIEIQDRFLTNLAKSSVKLVVEYMDSSKNVTKTIDDLEKKQLDNGDYTYTTQFEVLDGQGMTNMSIQVIDNAGNATAVINVEEAAKMTTFGFDKATQTNNYLGSTAVVDTTTPKATLTIGGNVESFYTYKGVAYVKLANPATGMSGALAAQKDETVTLTINVTDKNVTLDSKNAYPVKNNTTGDATNWSGTPLKNADTTVTYFDQITVAADKTGYFKFDLTVYDLAGNAITDEDITVTAINNTVPNNLKEMVKTAEGKFGTIISLDRRRPSTVTDDNNAPVINIQPSIGFTTSNNNKELYANAFSFALTVTDGTADSTNSGLNSVDWVIEDPAGFVAPANVVNAQKEGTYAQTYVIPVTLATAAGESNSVKLTIAATDNVGNTTTYVREFAVDNLAPRVTVSYDNNSVLNGKYFKADRIASIRVEDINFNAAATPITTEVPVSAWVQAGDVYTASCAYTTDGEYTFDMSATDKAANASEIDFTNGGRNAAPKAFTLDKTAPVINVSYNPASPVGTDPQGVQYYSADLGVTVTITEVNFNSAEVRANMGDRNALSYWSNSGSRHTASTTYTEGNNYSFNIQYTDLAGNAATPYASAAFSVDTHAPTIEITQGDLTNKELNIVQGDLVLSFTIKDEQQNLSGYTVKVTHLNNEFKETVVEGAEYYVVNDANDRTIVYVNFDSIKSIKENDGTYNVQITASDYAGHHVSLAPSLNFSLNRFGSTFMTDDEFTARFLEPSSDGVVYQNAVSNKLIIKEINPNKVWQDDSKKTEGSVITIAVNGQSIILEKGTDYNVTMTEEGTGSNKWYVYTYEIDPANFLDGSEQVDGSYTVLLYGVDEAGNKNTNESNAYSTVQKDGEGEYSGKISFTLDHKAPVITTYGVESNDSIDAEFKQLNINLSDNTPATVKVLVDGVEVALSASMEGLANDQLWLAKNEQTGEYVLNIPESNEKRTITIITSDAAGNTAEQVVENVLITSNAFVRAINNPWIVGGFSLGLLAMIIFFVFAMKKKKNKAQQPA